MEHLFWNNQNKCVFQPKRRLFGMRIQSFLWRRNCIFAHYTRLSPGDKAEMEQIEQVKRPSNYLLVKECILCYNFLQNVYSLTSGGYNLSFFIKITMPFCILRIWATSTNLRVKNIFHANPHDSALRNHKSR